MRKTGIAFVMNTFSPNNNDCMVKKLKILWQGFAGYSLLQYEAILDSLE